MNHEICPNRFEKMDLDNLAYELVFAVGYDYQDFQKTVVWNRYNIKMENWIKIGVDPILHKLFLDKEVHYFLKQANKQGGKSCLRLLLDYIDKVNQEEEAPEQTKVVLKKPTVNEKEDEESFDISSDAEISEMSEDVPGFQGYDDENGMIVYTELSDGRYEFRYKYNTQDVFMYAVPCCPKCHKRLPIGWLEADDFCGISLMARTGGGKTSLLLSMMHNDWEAFQQLGSYPDPNDSDKELLIMTAHDENDEKDAAYAGLKEASDKMCQDYGDCPPNTRTEGWVSPVFLQVDYGEHKMIVGLYDNSGEVLKKMNRNDERIQKLKHMFATIYLIEPEQLNINLPKDPEKEVQELKEKCQMVPLDQQGIYQQENAGKRVSGAELLNVMSEPVQKKTEKPFEMLNIYQKSLKMAGRQLHDIYFCGTIIKSDLIENVEEIKQTENYEHLFEREMPEDLLDSNAIQERNILVKEMIERNNLFGDGEQMKKIERTCGGEDNVSWHCISALGCGTDTVGEGSEKHGELKGEYAPIRVAEPLVTCILKRIERNGWTEA